MRAFTPFALLLSLTLVAGCDALEKRKVKKSFEAASDKVTSALEAMKKADSKVLVVRAKLKKTSASDTDAFVKVAHDYSEALQGTVKSGGQLETALDGEFAVDTDVGRALASRVRRASSNLKSMCGRDLKFDEIDPCGGAWGEMIDAAISLAERSQQYGLSWPKVRTEETMAAAAKGGKAKGDDDDDDKGKKSKAKDDDEEK